MELYCEVLEASFGLSFCSIRVPALLEWQHGTLSLPHVQSTMDVPARYALALYIKAPMPLTL